MILTSIILFTLAAVMGLSLAVMGVRRQRGHLALGMVHACTAVLALALLAAGIFRGPVDKLYNNAAMLFLLTLTGGVVLLALHESRKPPPMIVVGVHGLIAFAALVVLLIGYSHR